MELPQTTDVLERDCFRFYACRQDKAIVLFRALLSEPSIAGNMLAVYTQKVFAHVCACTKLKHSHYLHDRTQNCTCTLYNVYGHEYKTVMWRIQYRVCPEAWSRYTRQFTWADLQSTASGYLLEDTVTISGPNYASMKHLCILLLFGNHFVCTYQVHARMILRLP